MAKAKVKPVYKVISTRCRTGQKYEAVGTVEELVKHFAYTLECGASYQHEKGNKKINQNPKNIEALVKNLYNAKNNAAADGWGGFTYSYEEVNPVEAMALGESVA